MALIAFDGFDYMGLDSFGLPNQHWTELFQTMYASWNGRDDGYAVSGNPLITSTFSITGNTLVVGFDTRMTNSFSTVADRNRIAIFFDGTTRVLEFIRQAEIGVVDLHFNGALLKADVFGQSVSSEQWMYLETKIVFDGAAGSIVVQFEGTQVYDSGAMDTTAGGAISVVDTIQVSPDHSSYPYHIDNMYILDGSGTEFNDFLGPVKVAFVPVAAEDTVQFTPLSGTDNSLMIDDWPGLHDSDTTYNTSGVTGETDLFTLATLPVTSKSPAAVAPTFNAKTEGGANSMAGVIKSNVTEGEGPTQALTTGYLTYIGAIFTTDPDTGAAWTEAAVQALKVGYRNKG